MAWRDNHAISSVWVGQLDGQLQLRRRACQVNINFLIHKLKSGWKVAYYWTSALLFSFANFFNLLIGQINLSFHICGMTFIKIARYPVLTCSSVWDIGIVSLSCICDHLFKELVLEFLMGHIFYREELFDVFINASLIWQLLYSSAHWNRWYNVVDKFIELRLTCFWIPISICLLRQNIESP